MTPQTTSPGPVPLVPSVAWPSVRGAVRATLDEWLVFALFVACSTKAPWWLREFVAAVAFVQDALEDDLPHRLN